MEPIFNDTHRQPRIAGKVQCSTQGLVTVRTRRLGFWLQSESEDLQGTGVRKVRKRAESFSRDGTDGCSDDRWAQRKICKVLEGIICDDELHTTTKFGEAILDSGDSMAFFHFFCAFIFASWLSKHAKHPSHPHRTESAVACQYSKSYLTYSHITRRQKGHTVSTWTLLCFSKLGTSHTIIGCLT
jgi:hypothetical protein